MFSCIHGRIFLKEPIEKLNVFNVGLVVAGIVLIVQPPMIFGQTDSIYHKDKMALYAAIGCSLTSAIVEPLKNVALRSLKGRVCLMLQK